MKQEKAINILLPFLCGFLFVVNGESIFLYNQTYNRHTYVLPLRSFMDQWGTITHDPLRNNFAAAQRWCASHFNGSKLATIKSEAIQRNISHFISGAIYSLRLSNLAYVRIGGKSYDEWRWVNGKILSGDLTPASSAFTYGALMERNNRFVGRTQNAGKAYICQNSGNREGYVVGSSSADWTNARNSCKREGGDLASFDSFNNTRAFDAFAQRLSLVRGWEYWVGLQKQAIWRWEADSKMNYTNWRSGQILTTTDQCALLYFPPNPNEQAGTWAAFPCDHQLPFICEIIDTREPTTVATTESMTSSTAPETTTPVATTTKTTTVAVAQTSRQNPQETDKIQLSITEPVGRHPTSSGTLSSTVVALSIAVGVCATIAIAIAFLLIVTIKKHRTSRSNGTPFPTVGDNEHSSAAAAAAAAFASQMESKQTAGSNTNHNNKQIINANCNTDKNSTNLNAASTRKKTHGENQQQQQQQKQQQSTIYASVQDTRGGNSPPPGKGNETTSAAAADKGKFIYAEVEFNRPSNK